MSAINAGGLPKESGPTAVRVLLGGWIVLFLAGTAIWATAKGHHPIVGIVLGAFGPIGLLILAFLSDESKRFDRRRLYRTEIPQDRGE